MGEPVHYVIRCSECRTHAPLVGELLGEMSAQVLAFQAGHEHAAGRFSVDAAPDVIVLDAPATPAALTAA